MKLKRCHVCGLGDEHDDQILCDRCEKGYHFKCVEKENTQPLEDEYWYCLGCQQAIKKLDLEERHVTELPELIAYLKDGVRPAGLTDK